MVVRTSLCPNSSWTVQELLGHADVATTMIYTYVLNRPGVVRVVSPGDFEWDRGGGEFFLPKGPMVFPGLDHGSGQNSVARS